MLIRETTFYVASRSCPGRRRGTLFPVVSLSGCDGCGRGWIPLRLRLADYLGSADLLEIRVSTQSERRGVRGGQCGGRLPAGAAADQRGLERLAGKEKGPRADRASLWRG